MAKSTPTPEDFKALADKKPSVMQKGLAEFIGEVTSKKVTPEMVGIVQRFSAPYRLTEHYESTKAAWVGSRSEAEKARADRKAQAERERVSAKKAKLTAELERLAEIEQALVSETVVSEPAKLEPKPKPKSKAAKGAAKNKATKPVLSVVPDPEPESEEPVEVLNLGGSDEFVAPAVEPEWDDDEDFGEAPAAPTAPLITFDDGEALDDEDEDDDF